MLQRITAANGVVYYQSPLLAQAGIPHGFSTRIGGISRRPFDSLNLGNPNGCAVQDDEAQISVNYERLHSAVGLAERRRCWVHQVHGAALQIVEDGETFQNSQKADALLTSDPRAALSIRIADCVPVLLATADGQHVAGVHAGWRGVIGGAVPVAVAALRERTADQAIIVAIGPSISGAAFEVGPEVADEFTRAFGSRAPVSVPNAGGKPYVDLRAAIVLQLLDLGVDEAAIDVTDRCTVRDADEFFSHRRDNGVTGRMAALIGTRV
ncbi:MAG TPA: peptidoglycan editing factor PgeF [Tepidisphaeraceae bacterium]|jgi:hypothetical protein|nr:peptidoglycan editing factor PgeF [Tepidisphaeraceae bacterium]